MYMAEVVGNVVSTKKEDSLTGKKLMVIQRINTELERIGDQEVAVDAVGSGIGEYVIIASGSPVRHIFSPVACIDKAIVGIIDSIE